MNTKKYQTFPKAYQMIVLVIFFFLLEVNVEANTLRKGRKMEIFLILILSGQHNIFK